MRVQIAQLQFYKQLKHNFFICKKLHDCVCQSKCTTTCMPLVHLALMPRSFKL